MTRKRVERFSRLYDRMAYMGFNADEVETLRRIQMTLHRWAEQECGDSNAFASWCTERDETTGIPYRVMYPHTGPGREVRIPDRETGALRRLHTILARHPGIIYYHQTDPRGCALYLIDNRDGQTIPTVGPDTWINSHYSSAGVAICY